MASIACNLALLPDQKLVDKTVEISRKLAQFGSYFVLEDGKCFPHISVYKFQLKAEDAPKVGKVLAAIAQKMSQLQLNAQRYNYEHDGFPFINVQYEKTAELLALQEEVVRLINPIREGMRESDKKRMLSADGLALEYFQEFGYNLVGELFHPHISLTELKAPSKEAQKALVDIHYFDGNFAGLGLFETSHHGTAIRKLTEPRLFRAQA